MAPPIYSYKNINVLPYNRQPHTLSEIIIKNVIRPPPPNVDSMATAMLQEDVFNMVVDMISLNSVPNWTYSHKP